MSYARFGWDNSDVYIYEHVGGFIECCGCSITEPDEHEVVGFFRANTAREILAHIDQHIKEGDTVPKDCAERIREEHPDLDAQIPPYVRTPEEEARHKALFAKWKEEYDERTKTSDV